MASPMHATNRRQFLRSSLTAAAGAVALQPPRASRVSRLATQPSHYIRVRGRVRAGNRGVPDVAISDGLSVQLTDPEGHFELITARDAFIRCSIPGTYEIATNQNGTARLYQKVNADARGEASVLFELTPRRESAEHHQFLVLAD